jgi:predicted transcriptional regulator
MKKTTVYLPDATHRSLGEVARRENKSQADLIRAAIEAYLERFKYPWPQSIGMGEDTELSARDAKAWVRRAWDEQHRDR